MSFVYDIADLYKADITIPVAFELAAKKTDDIGSDVRIRLRDEMKKMKLLERMASDIKRLLTDSDEEEDYQSTLYLWDNKRDNVDHGVSYGEDLD